MGKHPKSGGPKPETEGASTDRAYWIGRKRAAMASARGAFTSEARLFHYEMAGRHSIRAANCLPFLIVNKGPTTSGEGEALRVPRPPSVFRTQPLRLRLPAPPGKPGNDA